MNEVPKVLPTLESLSAPHPKDVLCEECLVSLPMRTARNHDWVCWDGRWWCHRHEAIPARLAQEALYKPSPRKKGEVSWTEV
jgi:hypothetical protein